MDERADGCGRKGPSPSWFVDGGRKGWLLGRSLVQVED